MVSTPIKTLGLRRLGLAPVDMWRSRVMHRDIGRHQGAPTILRRLCDRNSLDPPILVASLARSFLHYNYSRCMGAYRIVDISIGSHINVLAY